jgi:hypothetical protein
MSMCYRIGATALVLLVLLCPVAEAAGEIRFVETDVDLRADGSAVLAYTVQWRVISGELHGFCLENQDHLPLGMAVDASYAVDSRGNRYALSIREVAHRKWDIVLADGHGVGSGDVTYVFVIETHFAEAGYVEPTTSADGRELMVFNWSPVEWEEAAHQKHYTLKVLTPYTLPAGVDPRTHVVENNWCSPSLGEHCRGGEIPAQLHQPEGP